MPESVRPQTTRALAQVVAAQTLTPHMRRITVGGPDVAALLQAEGMDAPAAWVKVFLPCGAGRAYTISGLDHQAGTLDLDFVLHGADAASGPAAAWASQARVGERLGIAGPRGGGFALPADARWLLLAGDATALPAIQAIARKLPAGLRTKVYVEMPHAADQQAMASSAAPRCAWSGWPRAPPTAWRCISTSCTGPCPRVRAICGLRASLRRCARCGCTICRSAGLNGIG